MYVITLWSTNMAIEHGHRHNEFFQWEWCCSIVFCEHLPEVNPIKIPLNHYKIPFNHYKILFNHHKIPFKHYKIPFNHYLYHFHGSKGRRLPQDAPYEGLDVQRFVLSLACRPWLTTSALIWRSSRAAQKWHPLANYRTTIGKWWFFYGCIYIYR